MEALYSPTCHLLKSLPMSTCGLWEALCKLWQQLRVLLGSGAWLVGGGVLGACLPKVNASLPSSFPSPSASAAMKWVDFLPVPFHEDASA